MNPQRLCALLLCSVFLGLLALAGPLRVWSQSSAPEAPGGEVCALSDKQQADAPKAFTQMVSTFQHPRCMNCHGAVDPYSGKNHMGGKKLRENCGGCHRLPEGEGDTPEAGLFFTGKDAVQLCRQMKRTLPDESAFIAHITEDRGRTPFIQTAFAGTRALNNLGRQMYERRTGKEYRPEPANYARCVHRASRSMDRRHRRQVPGRPGVRLRAPSLFPLDRYGVRSRFHCG